MIQLEGAIRLCEEAQKHVPELERWIKEVREISPRCTNKPETYRYSVLHQTMAEVCARMQLQAAAQVIPDLVELVEIPDGTQTKHYIFKKEKYTTKVVDLETVNLETEKTVTDIDALVAIAEGKTGKASRRWHPFLVEVKMGGFGYCNESPEVEHYSYPLRQIIRKPYKFLNGIQPVLELFQQFHDNGEIENKPKDIGLIIVMPPDKYYPILCSSLYAFKERGGNIIPFHKSLSDYSQSIYAYADRFNFKVA